jgi:SOS-response transcriptional repressor LexA
MTVKLQPKRVTLVKDSLILNSDNKDFAPMIYEANKCMIIGKVIGRYGVVK